VPASVRGAAPNLRARELDAESGFAAIRTRYAAGIDALFDRIARGSAFDAAHDRRVMRDLIELAPPGIDELVAILEVTDALSPAGGEPTFDLVVMDTAPSGHALRLLEMPALVQDWVKALMAILLKYQPVAGIGEIGGILLRLSQGLGRLRELMGDGDRTRFIAVTRPASLPRAETGRLLQGVAAVGLAVPAIVVNAAGAGTCRYCATVDRLQRREIRATQALARRRAARVVITPAVMPPPRGAAALVRWMRGWRELDADRGNSGGRRRRA
jgi:arsenite-transporting ATPase